ncbi:MAG: sodium:proton antiporter [Chitinophagales bacterium]|nr:sodium:proton antiporter [Chitinophagales bacterium]
MEAFHLISFLILITAILAYINHRYIKLPTTIGLMLLSLLMSLLVFPITHFFPGFLTTAQNIVNSFEFSELVLDVFLCYLLFAGAYHTNYSDLAKEKLSVSAFAFIGVFVCTFLVGIGIYYILQWIGYDASIWSCLLFGSLISPTDPIAVLGILADSKMPNRIKTNIIGESLFNDGIGVVIFISIATILSNGVEQASVIGFLKLFALEAGGGVALGIVIGYIVYKLLKSIDHYQTEMFITLAAVTTGYVAAQQLHISGPLAMVVAGLFIGNRARGGVAMSDATEQYIDKFWHMLDELLNALLFVLIGLEVLVVEIKSSYWIIAILGLILMLVARYISVSIPYLLVNKKSKLPKETPFLMTWGGLRGGLSIAMALSISKSLPEKDLWVFVTYIIVLFAIIVQATTLKKILNKLYK